MSKKIKPNKTYKAIYNKWGLDEVIKFTASIVHLENKNIYTISPKNDLVSVIKESGVLQFNIEEYSGDRFLCSQFMGDIREIKEDNSK
jgi:hypothetical protein